MTTGYPASFGYDVIDLLDWGFDLYQYEPVESEGYDTIDWIEDGAYDLPTLCPICNEAWLMGPEVWPQGSAGTAAPTEVRHERNA